jgi:hypothetical protein
MVVFFRLKFSPYFNLKNNNFRPKRRFVKSAPDQVDDGDVGLRRRRRRGRVVGEVRRSPVRVQAVRDVAEQLEVDWTNLGANPTPSEFTATTPAL